MKKILLIVLATMLLCTACDEKTGPSIMGRWQVTDEYHRSEFGSVNHHELESTTIYDFRPENKLVATTIVDGDTNVIDNLLWGTRGDTLIMFQQREPDQEPGMPGVLQILKLTEQEMSWCYLILGNLYIDLKRI